MLDLLLVHPLQILLLLLDQLQLGGQVLPDSLYLTILPLQLLVALVQRHLPLFQLSLHGLDLGVALSDLLL